MPPQEKQNMSFLEKGVDKRADGKKELDKKVDIGHIPFAELSILDVVFALRIP